jgi:hypothetical protein
MTRAGEERLTRILPACLLVVEYPTSMAATAFASLSSSASL